MWQLYTIFNYYLRGSSCYDVHLSMNEQINRGSLKHKNVGMLNVSISPGCWVFNNFWSSKFPRAINLMWLFLFEHIFVRKKNTVVRIYCISLPRHIITFYSINNISIILKVTASVAIVEWFEWSALKVNLKFRFLVQFFGVQSKEMLLLMKKEYKYLIKATGLTW